MQQERQTKITIRNYMGVCLLFIFRRAGQQTVYSEPSWRRWWLTAPISSNHQARGLEICWGAQNLLLPGALPVRVPAHGPSLAARGAGWPRGHPPRRPPVRRA